MAERPLGAIEEHFGTVRDPRIERTKEHKLIDIIVIAICAVICEAEGWVDIENYGKSKKRWLKTFLELPNGIPSHDTFGRVFSLLDAQEFQAAFYSWVLAVNEITQGQIINVDGKCMHGSEDKALGKRAIYMVSAWAEANHLVLGQRRVDEKSNEITAIPELLKILAISGCIITVDAIGTQTDIAKTVIEADADYVLSIKENQGHLYEDISTLFAVDQAQDFKYASFEYEKTTYKGHGRIEIRECWSTSNPECLNLIRHSESWVGLKSIAMMVCTRIIDGAETRRVRFYITSLPSDAVEMNMQPVSNFNADPALCSAGLVPGNVFHDDLESGISNWTIHNGSTTRWQYGSPYGPFAHSGVNFLYADDYPAAITDANVTLDSFPIPSNGYLYFTHAYDFENYYYSSTYYYFDGGVLEYSTDGGVNWLDAGSLIEANGYDGNITTYYSNNNPLRGRSAFVGISHGYIGSRVNLSSLAGKTVAFRWRMGLDEDGYRWGWWLDDVQVYQCSDAGPHVLLSVPANGNPTAASSVDFKVIFSEPVTGVDDPLDFALTKSITDASITAINGSGTTYIVTVNTGTSNGTIRLDIPTTATINDLTGNPLEGLPYTEGTVYLVNKAASRLISPINTGYAVTTRPTFKWKAVKGDLEYHLQVDNSELFNSVEVDHYQTRGSSYRSPALSYGNHYWRIQVRTAGGWSDWTPAWEFTLSPPLSPPPGLISPTRKALLTDNTPTLMWSTVTGNSRYEVQIDNDSRFKSPEQTHLTGVGEVNYTATSLPDGNYYWRVRTINYLDIPGKWSKSSYFTVDTIPPAAPVLLMPYDGGSNIGIPVFKWQSSYTAKYYQFQYNDTADPGDEDPTSVIYRSAVYTGRSHKPPSMTQMFQYYWFVRAKDKAGNWSNWSTPFRITIVPPPPAAPRLIAPPNGSVSVLNPPQLSWSGVLYGNTYEVQISTLSSFLGATVLENGAATSYTPPDPLADAKYYWRVRARNVNGASGSWSVVRSFIIRSP